MSTLYMGKQTIHVSEKLYNRFKQLRALNDQSEEKCLTYLIDRATLCGTLVGDEMV